jgi:hypothetical protein
MGPDRKAFVTVEHMVQFERLPLNGSDMTKLKQKGTWIKRSNL